jgi:purine-binding chemotaxis protein CheW
MGRPLMASTANDLDCGGRTSWLVCRAGGHLCALPLAEVAETMRPLPLEQVSGAPPAMHGLSIIRGLPVPVVDLGLMLGAAASEPGRLVTVKVSARTVALALDSVVGIWAIEREECTALPPLLRDAGETVSAIGSRDAELLLFLSAARTITPEMLARFEGAAP